jgi:hypothetical protein
MSSVLFEECASALCQFHTARRDWTEVIPLPMDDINFCCFMTAPAHGNTVQFSQTSWRK